MYLLKIILLLLADFIITNENSSRTKLLIMISRHGNRAPVESYPTDPYSSLVYWPEGWGELTREGKNEMYELGQYIRQQYKGFLNYSPRDVYIRSSNFDRCLESAALVMAGDYKPEGIWKWNKNLGTLWQPFPIQTVPAEIDGLLNDNSVCLSAAQEINRINNSPEVRKYMQTMEPFLTYVSYYSGLNISDLMNITTMTELLLFDTLFVERQQNYPLPPWVTNYVYEKLSSIGNSYFIFTSSTKMILRLRIGLLLKEIISNIKTYLNNTQTSKTVSTLDTVNTNFNNYYLYLTSDTEIAWLLSALNIFDGRRPLTGSTVLIELVEKNQQLMIEVFYLYSAKSRYPIRQILPRCANNKQECPLSSFIKSINDLLPNDWQKECNNTV